MQQGNIVQLHRTVLRSGVEKTLVTLAFVLGVVTEPGYASEDGSPALNLAYLDPDRANLIGSTDWRNAIDRQSTVKHESHEHVANSSERVFYTTLDELTAGDHALVELGQISEFVRKAFPDASGENVAEIVIGLLDQDKPASWPMSYEEVKEKVVEQLDEAAPTAGDIRKVDLGTEEAAQQVQEFRESGPAAVAEQASGDQGTDSPNQASEAAGV